MPGAGAPLILRFWKKKRKVLFMPMIIMTPARNRICRRRGGQRPWAQQCEDSYARATRHSAHVAHSKEPLVKEHHHAKHHEKQARASQANPNFCARREATRGVSWRLWAELHGWLRLR